MRKFLIGWFLVFELLSIVALIPGGALFALILTGMVLPLFGVPGFLVIVAPTVLIYSAALLPGWFLVTGRKRCLRPVIVGGAGVLAVATVPGLVSQLRVIASARHAARTDFARPAAATPRLIELAGDPASGLFPFNEYVGDRSAPCSDICRRLLFGGEVEEVRMTQIPTISMGRRTGSDRTVTYHIEHRDSCPAAYPLGMTIESAFRQRLLAGDCLISTADGKEVPDIVVRFITSYWNQYYPPKPPDEGPASIETVKRIDISARQDGQLTPIVQRTETVARTVAMPFYIGMEMHMQGGYNGPRIGRSQTVVNAIDLAQMLRDEFGYKVAPIAAAPAEDPRKLVNNILALPPTAPTFTAPQQEVINDVLRPMPAKTTLDAADVDLIRRVIADSRIDSPQIGISLSDVFRRHQEELRGLIPIVLERMKLPIPEQMGHYQSALGWAVARYPSEELEPYRDQIAAVLEAQPDWPSVGLLTRIAELGGQPTELIEQRLDAKSTTVRQFAAIATCRAPDEAWLKLEPAVRSHVSAGAGHNAYWEVTSSLYLALIRHGEKPFVVEMIEQSTAFDKERMLKRVATLEAGFSPDRCRENI